MLEQQIEKAKSLGAVNLVVMDRSGNRLEFDLTAPVNVESFIKPDQFESAQFTNLGGGFVGWINAGSNENWINPSGNDLPMAVG